MTPNEHKIYITLKGKEKSDFFKKISIRDTEERLKREKKEKKEKEEQRIKAEQARIKKLKAERNEYGGA